MILGAQSLDYRDKSARRWNKFLSMAIGKISDRGGTGTLAILALSALDDLRRCRGQGPARARRYQYQVGRSLQRVERRREPHRIRAFGYLQGAHRRAGDRASVRPDGEEVTLSVGGPHDASGGNALRLAGRRSKRAGLNAARTAEPTRGNVGGDRWRAAPRTTNMSVTPLITSTFWELGLPLANDVHEVRP